MLPAAHRLRRSKDFAHTVRRGRRSGRGSVVVHLTSASAGSGSAGFTSGAGGEQAASMQPAVTGVKPAKAGFAVPDERAGEAVRVGFVVSKAVGGAVTRNKVKRRLRHLMAERLDRLPAGSSVVVRAQPGAGSVTYPQLGLDLDLALEDALRPRGRR